MKYFENLIVFLSITFMAQAYDLTSMNSAAPSPGALSLYFNQTAMNNLFQTAVPIGAYFGLNGRTFNTNLQKKSLFYELDLKFIKIIQAGGFKTKYLKYDKGTNVIHIHVDGINLDTEVDATFKALKLIPFESSAVNITGMSIDFKIDATPNGDKVHWKLKDAVDLSIGDVKINMKNSVLNYMVHEAIGLINKAINEFVIPKVNEYLTQEIENLNSMISSEGAYTFTTNLGGKDVDLNLTMPTAPQAIGNTDLVKVFFDGLFVPAKGSDLKQHVDFRGAIKDYAPRIEHSLSQQIWFHENFFNSLIDINPAALFPFKWESDAVSKKIYSQFPGVSKICNGKQAGIQYSIGRSVSVDDKAITFDRKTGVTFGGQKDNIKTEVDIYCSDSKAEVYSFESQIRAVANITLHNFNIYPVFENAYIFDTYVTKGDLNKGAPYTMQMQQITYEFIHDLTTKYKNGWSLANLNPMLGMAAGLIKNSTASPFVTDNLLFTGLEMQADLPNEQNPALEFIQ